MNQKSFKRHRSFLLFVLCFLLSLPSLPALAQLPAASHNTVHPVEKEHIKVDPATDLGYVDNILVVVTKEGINEEEVLSWLPGENASVVGRFPGLHQLQIKINPRDKTQLQALADQLMLKAEVRYAHLELAARYPGYTGQSDQEEEEGGFGDELPASQQKPGEEWWYQAISLSQTRDSFKSLDYVKVAVVDDGFDTEHPDLKLAFTSQESMQLNLGEHHGTHVAGIISQMLPGATITVSDAYRIPEHDPTWYLSVQSQYLKYLVDLVEAQAKVINYSMGQDIHEDSLLPWHNEYSAVLSVYIWLLKQAGNDFIITQSAGNTGIDSRRNGYFAGISEQNCLGNSKVQASLGLADQLEAARQSVMDSLVIVTAVDRYKPGEQAIVPPDANIGPGVSLAAPGMDIYSTVLGGYRMSGGTSQAAPIAAGALALLWSRDKSLTSGQVKRLLIDSATSFASNPNAKTGERTAYPMINLVEALRQLEKKN